MEDYNNMKLIFIHNKIITKDKLFSQYKKYNVKFIKKMSEIFFEELYEALVNNFRHFQKKISKQDMRKLFWTITSFYKSDRDGSLVSQEKNIKIYLGSFTPNIPFSIARKTLDLYYQYVVDGDYFNLQFVETKITNNLQSADELTPEETSQLEKITSLIDDIIRNQDMVSSALLEKSKLTLGQIDLIPEMKSYYSILDQLLNPEMGEERYFVEINNKKIYFDKLGKFTSPDRLKQYRDLDREYNRLSNYSHPD